MSAMRSLRRLLGSAGISEKEARKLRDVLEQALLAKVDSGAGEEFRALAQIAKAVATKGLITGLEHRMRNATDEPARINAQRMLDVIHGKPYRRYRVCI